MVYRKYGHLGNKDFGILPDTAYWKRETFKQTATVMETVSVYITADV